MEATKTQTGSQNPTLPVDPAMTSCRKKKSENATFLQDVRDHIDEFINASMDEHKTCFQKTIKKMFGMSKAVAERSSVESKEVETVLPLQTTVSK
ncbi:Dipeptide transport ATP-binding protein dppF [Rhynchospora pubera]|uniref:Dipeptide transport ATP-binding protein dppF n=2 Tax=Rhynchospora pubera TaxID=906938 RepID=A0AAV8HBN3_9POAL|nr:Dipeptide transport ATP-binding protein dppF [Rhynchospora pubera]